MKRYHSNVQQLLTPYSEQPDKDFPTDWLRVLVLSQESFHFSLWIRQLSPRLFKLKVLFQYSEYVYDDSIFVDLFYALVEGMQKKHLSQQEYDGFHLEWMESIEDELPAFLISSDQRLTIILIKKIEYIFQEIEQRLESNPSPPLSRDELQHILQSTPDAFGDFFEDNSATYQRFSYADQKQSEYAEKGSDDVLLFETIGHRQDDSRSWKANILSSFRQTTKASPEEEEDEPTYIFSHTIFDASEQASVTSGSQNRFNFAVNRDEEGANETSTQMNLFDVILTSPGFSEFRTGKVLSIVLSISYVEAVEILSQTPCTIVWSVTKEQGLQIKSLIEKTGAKVKLTAPV